jgi:hypothetical protein
MTSRAPRRVRGCGSSPAAYVISNFDVRIAPGHTLEQNILR